MIGRRYRLWAGPIWADIIVTPNRRWVGQVLRWLPTAALFGIVYGCALWYAGR